MYPTNQQPSFDSFTKALGASATNPTPPTPLWSDKLQSLYHNSSQTAPTSSGIGGFTNSNNSASGSFLPSYMSKDITDTASSVAKNITDIPSIAQKNGGGVSGYANAINKQTINNAGDIVGGGFSLAGHILSQFLPKAVQEGTAPINQIGTTIQHGMQGDAELVNKVPGMTGILNVLNDYFDKNPEDAHAIKSAITLGTLAGGGEAAPGVVGAVKDTATNLADKAAGITSDVTGAIKDNPLIKAGTEKITNIAKPGNPDELVGKVLQGKESHVPSGKSALSSLDTRGVKTYKDLKNLSNSKISSLVKEQDANLAKDTTNRPIDSFEKTVGQGESEVKTNYVKQAIDHLKELYTSTSDAKGLASIIKIENKANKVGLTTQEVNQLARDYGSEFKSKAFSKSGDPLTSINAQKFENIRTGLKNTARDLLPDDASRALDKQMTDLYVVRDLSKKMADKVTTLTQRLQKPNVLQKIGGFLGKATRTTGVGDFASKLLGIEKVPGAATLNPVELEAELNGNLGRINAALNKPDEGFIKDIIEEAKNKFGRH